MTSQDVRLDGQTTSTAQGWMILVVMLGAIPIALAFSAASSVWGLQYREENPGFVMNPGWGTFVWMIIPAILYGFIGHKWRSSVLWVCSGLSLSPTAAAIMEWVRPDTVGVTDSVIAVVIVAALWALAASRGFGFSPMIGYLTSGAMIFTCGVYLVFTGRHTEQLVAFGLFFTLAVAISYWAWMAQDLHILWGLPGPLFFLFAPAFQRWQAAYDTIAFPGLAWGLLAIGIPTASLVALDWRALRDPKLPDLTAARAERAQRSSR